MTTEPDTPAARPALDPAAPAGEAARTVLRELLDALRAHLPGVGEVRDVEALHAVRIAVRRTRSVLDQLPGTLPAAAVDHFGGEFRWLGEITGPVRDLDIFLPRFEAQAARLPPECRGQLAPIVGLIHQRMGEERQRMAVALESDRCVDLQRDWEAFLRQPETEEPRPPQADAPIAELVARRIRKRFRTVLQSGAAVTDACPPEHLHAVRIQCKKLRYLVEVFRELCDPGEAESFVAVLKRLQSCLGDLNDDAVCARTLEDLALELARRSPSAQVSAPALIAVGRLVAGFDRHRARERKRFTRRFADLARKQNRRRLRRLLPGRVTAARLDGP